MKIEKQEFEKRENKKSPRRHFFPNHWSKFMNPFSYSYVECIYMLIINNNSLTINFSYITFATAKRKKRSLTTTTTTTTTKTNIVISRRPKNQRRGRHRRRLGTSASLAKTGCDAADSDAAGIYAADSDAAGIDAAQPGERSPP